MQCACAARRAGALLGNIWRRLWLGPANMAAAAAALAWLAAACLLLAAQVACEYGMVHVVSEMGGPKGKDYCILYNPQWAHLPHDLSKASLLQLRDWTTSMLCSASDLPAKGFSNQIPLVTRGNCTFYDKVRLAQGSGAHGLLIVSKETLVPPGGNKTQYEEIGIPVALLSYKDMLDIFKNFGRSVRAALYAPHEPMLDYNMVIIFIMAVGTVALGGYWAGSRDVKKRYMKHKRDDEPEKQEDEAVDVTPVMTCVFVVMCCSMLVLLYYFYDHLVYVIIGIFCLASSTGLYSCLSPLVQRLPFGKCRVCSSSLPYFHKCPQVRMLLLALFCVGVSVVWGIFRNEDQWAWILQDALGIAFCLYMLKTIRLPTFKACTLLLMVLFIYDIFFVFITPFLTKSGNSIMVEVATGPADSATREKLPMVLKVPRLNASPLALCDRPFSLLGFGDILVPGLLVAYCHRFDIQVQSSRVYFVACTIAYGIGLLVTFMALALMQRGQPALLYLVPCTLITSGALALWRGELGMFWTGSGFAKDLPQPPWVPASAEGPQPLKDSEVVFSQQPPGEAQVKPTLPEEQPLELADLQDVVSVSTQEPLSPASHTPEPSGLPGTLAKEDSAALVPCCPSKTGPAIPSTRCSGLANAHISASSSPATPGPRPCSQLMWPPQPLGLPRSPSRDPSPIFFLVRVSGEPQKGQERHLCPLMAAHLPHLVLTPCCCFLQVPLEMPCPGPEGSGLPPKAMAFLLQHSWSRCRKPRPGGVDSGPQPSWHGVCIHLWTGSGAGLRAASKAGGKWTGALGLSLTLVPWSAQECLQPVLRPTPPCLNKQPRLYEIPVVSPLLDCPSWRQDGHQAGWPGPWVHRARHPRALNSQLCPLCQLRCLSTEGPGFPFHITGICTFLTAFQHPTPWPPAAARARRASARSFWNVGEYFGTGILFSTSEPHDMPRGPLPAPSVHHRVACVTTTLNGRCLGATDCQDCLWPSDLAPPCPSTQPPDSCSEDFPSE